MKLFAEHTWEVVAREWRWNLFTKHLRGAHYLCVAWSSWGLPRSSRRLRAQIRPQSARMQA